jgi:hypothetical protein
MEFRDDEFDLTPRAPARPASGHDVFSAPSALPLTSEGFEEGGFGVMEAAEHGKPTTRLSEVMEEMDVSEEDGCDILFYLPGPSSVSFDKKVCSGVTRISSVRPGSWGNPSSWRRLRLERRESSQSSLL